MDAFEKYAQWRAASLEDGDLSTELSAIEGNEKEIYERFYTDLVFGTGGLRGVLGAGSNRMNIYVVRRATQGICKYLSREMKKCSAAVSYDSRNKSRLFAEAVAGVFAANGVKVYIYPELAPTPLLSWAVRYYGCDTGVMVTASHNPAEYNGYKAYDKNGCQITDKAAAEILGCIEETDIFTGVKCAGYQKAMAEGMIVPVDERAIAEYFKSVLACRCIPDAAEGSGLKIAYTPLNGTGNLFVRRILKDIGFPEPVLVKEQLTPDGNFPTCPYPNPEMKEALTLGLKTARENACDILIATDPDADRVGVAALHNGEYVLLSGNEVGVLMVDHVARSRAAHATMPKDPVMVKSIVTTTLADKVAASYGIKMINVLTGFKYIGDQIARLEQAGEADRFVFGFEESCGYLAGTYIREKDAIVAAMLVAEMAAFYKKQGKTLVDVMNGIYEKFGYHYNSVASFVFPGSDGMQKMADIMEKLFAAPPKSLGGYDTVSYCDYRAGICSCGGKTEKTGLPSSPVLSLELKDAGTVVVRPSGTEPKLKVYYMVCAADRAKAERIHGELSASVKELLGV